MVENVTEREALLAALIAGEFPDARGRFGPYGGQYIPETLMPAVTRLAAGVRDILPSAKFQARLREELTTWAGRPTALTHAARLTVFHETGASPGRWGSGHPEIVPYRAYRASDGWVFVAVWVDRLWRPFCEAIGRSELADDPRFAARASASNSPRLASVEYRRNNQAKPARTTSRFSTRPSGSSTSAIVRS